MGHSAPELNMSIQKAKNKFFLFYILLGVASCGAYFIPNERVKPLASYGAVLGLAGLINTELVSGVSESILEQEEKKYRECESESSDKFRALEKEGFQSKLELNTKVDTLTGQLKQSEDNLADKQAVIARLSKKIEGYGEKLAQNKMELEKLHEYNSSAVHELLRKAYDRNVKNVESLIDGYTRFYPEHTEAFNGVVIEVDKFKSRYSKKIQDYESIVSFQELLTEGLILQERIAEVSAKHRMKAQSIVISHLMNINEQEVTLNAEQESIIAALESSIAEASEKYDKQVEWTGVVKDKLEANIRGIAAEWVSFKDETINNYRTDYDEMLEGLRQAVSDIQVREARIAELEEMVAELSKPIMAYGRSSYAMAANDISAWYYKKGYVLDVLDWVETETGYEIKYSIKRNPGLTEQELYEGNSREQLAAFTNSLSGTLPKIEFNRQNSTITVVVQLRKPPKKAPIEKVEAEVDKIWVPASKFESYVKNFERVRITAGSTGGKSPTAKNLALAIMNVRKGEGEIRLYDPQDGSKKDYWNMPKAGTSHEDNFAGMKEVCDLINSRRHKKDNDFVLYIFDEIDNTASSLNVKYKFEMLDLIKTSIKEGSHANVGVIYIGQSADANEIPQMTHSNWNNCVGLHIGTNAGNVIDKLKSVTNEQKNKLLSQYHKIQDYCQTKNEELGLDVLTDASAYRFGLVVPLSGVPKFIQLPDYDSYDYEQVMSKKPENPEKDDPCKLEGISGQKDKTQTLKCPRCESTRIGTKGKQYHKCLDCEKTWKKRASY